MAIHIIEMRSHNHFFTILFKSLSFKILFLHFYALMNIDVINMIYYSQII